MRKAPPASGEWSIMAAIGVLGLEATNTVGPDPKDYPYRII